MAFEKGNTAGKGRPKGSPNNDGGLKLWVRELLNDDREEFKKQMKTLEGKSYTDTYISLMEYAVPKLARVEVKDESETTQNITINYTKKD